MGYRHPSKGGNANGSKWIWPRTRRRIYMRDGHRCVWCTKDLSRGVKARRTLDHVIPRLWSGSNHITNLITACLRCNTQRGDLSPLAFAWTFPSPDIVLERIATALEQPLPELPHDRRTTQGQARPNDCAG
jgi:5-methylcytosine-specific restriction endonuclease McrA